MEDYFKRMNEEYIKKNYPERSVFKAYKKSMGSRGRTGCIIMGLDVYKRQNQERLQIILHPLPLYLLEVVLWVK